MLQLSAIFRPVALELTAANESVVIDNLSIFEKNGFAFIIDENRESTTELYCVPSKEWHLTWVKHRRKPFPGFRPLFFNLVASTLVD